MGRRTAIGVDDDFPAGKSGVAIGAAHDKAAGRVHKIFFPAHPAFRQDLIDEGAHDFAHLRLIQRLAMLGRDHDRGGLHWPAILIEQSHLALASGPSPFPCRPARFGAASKCDARSKSGAGIKVLGLGAGVAEHDALSPAPSSLLPAASTPRRIGTANARSSR